MAFALLLQGKWGGKLTLEMRKNCQINAVKKLLGGL
ncbi:protein of unknown function [Pseudomonas sp. JV241A]|nr:protein of unknown function [Pseudomonas sp. JV241A]